MKKKTILFLFLILICGCTAPDDTKRLLQNNGYTEIEITGYRPFMGDKNDFYSTGFRAKNTNKIEVSGSITKGLFFKGATIRFD